MSPARPPSNTACISIVIITAVNSIGSTLNSKFTAINTSLK